MIALQRKRNHGRVIQYFEAAGQDYGEWSRDFNRERRNNVIAPVLGMLLGMSRPHFSYCIVSGRKAGGCAY